MGLNILYHLLARVENGLEQGFWIILTLTSFTFVGIMLHTAVSDWIHNPTGQTTLLLKTDNTYITMDSRGFH